MIKGPDDIEPMSDDAFRRAQRIGEARERRELERKMRERPLEAIIEDFSSKVESDPAAPLGKCDKCGEAYTARESGRLAEHVCASIVRAATTPHITAEERAAERSVDRTVMGIRRVRRDMGEEL
jgi:hypothetical protein